MKMKNMNASQRHTVVSCNADSDDWFFHSFHSSRCIFNLVSAVRRTAPEFQGKIWMSAYLRCVDLLLGDNAGENFFEFLFLSWQFTSCMKLWWIVESPVHSKISDVRSTVETQLLQDHSWEWRKMRKWETRNGRARPGFAVWQLWPLRLAESCFQIQRSIGVIQVDKLWGEANSVHWLAPGACFSTWIDGTFMEEDVSKWILLESRENNIIMSHIRIVTFCGFPNLGQHTHGKSASGAGRTWQMSCALVTMSVWPDNPPGEVRFHWGGYPGIRVSGAQKMRMFQRKNHRLRMSSALRATMSSNYI